MLTFGVGIYHIRQYLVKYLHWSGCTKQKSAKGFESFSAMMILNEIISFCQALSKKQGLIATPLSVLEAFVFKVDENFHPWTSTYLKKFIPGCSSTCVQSTKLHLKLQQLCSCPLKIGRLYLKTKLLQYSCSSYMQKSS